jgi:DNA-binding transcriptional MerR regulator
MALTIREVAAATGTSPHTLRYYERIGLMCDVPRTASGHRRYGAEEMRWIEFLRRMHESGMSIQRMHVYARLFRAGDATIPARRRLLEEHRRGLAARLAALGESLALVDQKIRMYARAERMRGGDSPERRLHRLNQRTLASVGAPKRRVRAK